MAKLNLTTGLRNHFGAIQGALDERFPRAGQVLRTANENKIGVASNLISAAAGPAAPLASTIIGGLGKAVTGKNNGLSFSDNFFSGTAQANRTKVFCYVAVAICAVVLPEVFALTAGCLHLPAPDFDTSSVNLTETYANNPNYTIVNNETLHNVAVGKDAFIGHEVHAENSVVDGFIAGKVNMKDTVLTSSNRYGIDVVGDIDINKLTFKGGDDDIFFYVPDKGSIDNVSVNTDGGPSVFEVITRAESHLADQTVDGNFSALDPILQVGREPLPPSETMPASQKFACDLI